jgi:opacity protein-like surface antigen
LLAIPIACALVLPFGTTEAGGRPDKDWKSWFGHFAGGWSFAQGGFGDVADDAWYLNGGATYWPDTWPAGIGLDLSWSEHDFSNAAIDRVNDAIEDNEDVFGANGRITGGEAEYWSLTVNGLWGPKSKGAVGFYVLGGVGIDWVDAVLTDDALVYYPPVCDPWYWWCYPGGYGTGEVVRLSEDATEFSYNAGLGLTFNLSSGSQVYVEAKYHAVELDRETSEVVPLTVGFRW